MSNNVFEQAIRQHLRFKTVRGSITTEDLFTIHLRGPELSLNRIAVDLDKEIKSLGEVSFVDDKPQEDKKLDLALAVVKEVIKIRKAEEDEIAKRAEIKRKRQILIDQLADAELRELKNKTPEELRAELAALED